MCRPVAAEPRIESKDTFKFYTDFRVYFCLTICQSFMSFMICASLFGLFTGCWVAAMSPVFIRILGPDLLNAAFGLLTAIRGVAGLVGPPLAGFAIDYFESREAAIVLSGR